MTKVMFKLFPGHFLTKNSFRTLDYDSLNFVYFNRRGKLKNHLINSHVKHGRFLQDIVVCLYKGKLYILDGQHRFLVCKHLGVPVYYKFIGEMHTEQEMIDAITDMNTIREKFTEQQSLDAFCAIGFKNYVLVKKLMTEFPKESLNFIINLCAGQIKRGAFDSFQKGTYQVTSYDFCYDILSELKYLDGIIQSPGRKLKGMINRARLGFAAFYNSTPSYDREIFAEHFGKQPLKACRESHNYLSYFQKEYKKALKNH